MGPVADLQITGALTYEYWINTTATSGFVIGRRNSNVAAGVASNVELLGDGRFQFVTNDGTTSSQVIQSTTSVNDGNWHHIAVTYLPATYTRIYVDGVQDAENTAGIFSSLNPGSLDFHLGYSSSASANFLNATLDEVKIWDIAKTDFSDRFNPVQGNESNLVAYYPMDENGGSTLVDRSVNANDGVISGATYLPSDLSVPAAPDNLIAYASSSTEITLEWTDNAENEVGFIIEVSSDYSFSSPIDISSSVSPANPGADVTSVTYSAGTDQPYFYRVTAINGSEDASSVSAVEFATTEAFPGFALDLDGTDDYVDLSSSAASFDILNNVTVEAWIKPDADVCNTVLWLGPSGTASDDFTQIMVGNGCSLTSNNVIVSYVAKDGVYEYVNYANADRTILFDGEWHHIALTYNGSITRIYLDGLELSASVVLGSNSGTFAGHNPAPVAAAIGSYNGNYFDGQIDEVRIWDIAKTDFSDRQSPLSGNESNLIAYYSFDENVGSTTIDRSNNINDGDLMGSPASVTSEATSPNVIAVTSSVSVLSEAQTGSGLFSVSVTYDQTMNSSVTPTITFTPDISAALTGINSDGWSLTTSTDDTYTVDY
ncbi:MAG: LamG-like jellyroll fold domain-containing protein, partial [Marinoscillum sp.]